MSETDSKLLRRYTTLSSAIHILKNRELTLLPISSWDDKNDTYFVDLYRKYYDATGVFALCFTAAKETYHHWKVFTQGIEGVCLEFHKEPFIENLQKKRGIECKYVKYTPLDKVSNYHVNDLPFLKREGYADEAEVRVIALSNSKKPKKTLTFDFTNLKRIRFNPWMPYDLCETLKEILGAIEGCSDIELRRSFLTNSGEWKRNGDIIFSEI